MRFLAVILLVLAYPAAAQHNHAQHHASYQSWVNKNGVGCCDSRDCGLLPDADERTTAGQLEVRVEGQWCPILSHHYLKSGNAPDWSSAHVCVLTAAPGRPESPCARLLCYQPRPLF